MPRESTRQPFRQEATGSHTEMEIRHTDSAVWVALSGILDRLGVEQLRHRVSRRLDRRGTRVVLDGRGLTHLDYRATAGLIAWNRRLREYNHQLYLHGWNDYLKAILVMEDWGRELGAVPSAIAPAATAPWRRPASGTGDAMP